MFLNRIKNKLSKSVIGGAMIIACFSILSKILGLARDRLLASLFGAGDTLDVYYAAFKLPDLIFNTLVLGALSAAFIPVFVQAKSLSGRHTENRDNALDHWQLASAVMNTILLVMAILGGVGFLLAPELMKLIAPGFAGDKLMLTIKLTRIMLASMVFFGISHVLSGILQSFKKFAIFSAAPLMYNAGIIAGIVWLTPWLGPVGLAWGVVAGAGLHMLIQWPSVFKLGFRWHWILAWKDKTVRKVGKLILPRTLGLAVSQVNQLVTMVIASTMAAGSIAVFNLAFNLQSVPVSIFAVSFAIASFPVFSESFAEKDNVKFVIQFSATTRRILFLIIPISIFLIALRAQIVRLALGAGQFDWQDTILTADAVGYFCLSLFAQGLTVLLARAFYAYHDTKTPVITGLASVLVNVAGSIWLGPKMGVGGLALSFSVSNIFNVILLWVILRRRLGWLDEKKIVLAVTRNITATIGGVVFLQITKYLVAGIVDMRTFAGVMTQFVSAGAAGLAVFLLVSWLVGCEEIKKIKELFKIRTEE